MNNREFTSKANCDHCGEPLKPMRTLSWFGEHVICAGSEKSCSKLEDKLKSRLRNKYGEDFEGCDKPLTEIIKMAHVTDRELYQSAKDQGLKSSEFKGNLDDFIEGLMVAKIISRDDGQIMEARFDDDSLVLEFDHYGVYRVDISV
jgi:hypothetical protein